MPRPTHFLDWNINQGVDSETEPPSDYAEDGAPADDPVYREYYNWRERLKGEWVRFFDQVKMRTWDLFRDQQLPAGIEGGTIDSSLDLPATLSQPGGHFVTRPVYVGGYRIHPLAAPAHTYATEEVTWWFVTADGALTSSSVDVGDPPPSEPWPGVPVFFVETDDTEIVAAGFFSHTGAVRLAQRILVSPEGLLSEESQASGRGILARGLGWLSSANAMSSVLGLVSKGVYHSTSGVYASTPGAGGPNAVGMARHAAWLLINARYEDDEEGTALATLVAPSGGQDSYCVIFGVGGVEVLIRQHAFVATPWANTIDATDGWTRLALLSPAGFSVSTLAALVASLTASGDVTTSSGDIEATAGDITAGGDVNAWGDANVGGDVVVAGGVLADGTLATLTGNIGAAAGSVRGQVVGFNTAQTRRLTFSGIHGGSGRLTNDPSTGWSGGGDLGVTTTSATGIAISFPLSSLPEGAIVTGAVVYGAAGSDGETRAEIARIDNAGAVSYFRSGSPAYDAFTNVAAPGPMTLTLDATEAVRTIAHADYTYALNVFHMTGQNSSRVIKVVITYTVQNL